MFRPRNKFDLPVTWGTAALLTAVLTYGLSNSCISAQTTVPDGKPEIKIGKPTRYQPNRLSEHAVAYYGAVWGIDALTVKAVESGELIRFSYQVLDPYKAGPLNEKTNSAFLVAPAAGIRLSVPSLEKVGQLRQSSTPEVGKFYWMAFSNPGRRVKRSDHVNVEIGQFHADGLVVE